MKNVLLPRGILFLLLTLALSLFSSFSWSAYQSGEAGDRQIFLIEKNTYEQKLFSVKQNSFSESISRSKQISGFKDLVIDPQGSQTSLIVFADQQEPMLGRLENVFGKSYRVTPLSLFLNDHSYTSTDLSNTQVAQNTEALVRILRNWKQPKRFLTIPLNQPDFVLESFFTTHPSATDLLLKCLEFIGNRSTLTANSHSVCLEFREFYQSPQGYQLALLAHNIYIRHGRILSLLRTLHSRANQSFLQEYLTFRSRYFNDIGAVLASIVYHPFPANHPSPSNLAVSILEQIGFEGMRGTLRHQHHELPTGISQNRNLEMVLRSKVLPTFSDAQLLQSLDPRALHGIYALEASEERLGLSQKNIDEILNFRISSPLKDLVEAWTHVEPRVRLWIFRSLFNEEMQNQFIDQSDYLKFLNTMTLALILFRKVEPRKFNSHALELTQLFDHMKNFASLSKPSISREKNSLRSAILNHFDYLSSKSLSGYVCKRILKFR